MKTYLLQISVFDYTNKTIKHEYKCCDHYNTIVNIKLNLIEEQMKDNYFGKILIDESCHTVISHITAISEKTIIYRIEEIEKI